MSGPLFGITLSVGVYLMFVKLQEKTKLSILNPVLLSGLLIGILLPLLKIDYAVYEDGGRMISTLIAPATVSLAIPLYKNLSLIKENIKLIFVSIISAVVMHALVLITILLILKTDQTVGFSLIPKSITTAFAADLSVSIKGLSEVTIASVIVTGIVGTLVAPYLNKWFNIKSDISIGLALGVSSHAIGTAKAAGVNSTQGSFASIGLIVTGLITVLVGPIIALIYQSLL